MILESCSNGGRGASIETRVGRRHAAQQGGCLGVVRMVEMKFDSQRKVGRPTVFRRSARQSISENWKSRCKYSSRPAWWWWRLYGGDAEEPQRKVLDPKTDQRTMELLRRCGVVRGEEHRCRKEPRAQGDFRKIAESHQLLLRSSKLETHGKLHGSRSAGAVQRIHSAAERLVHHLSHDAEVRAGHVLSFKWGRVGEIRMVENVVPRGGEIDSPVFADGDRAPQRQVQLAEREPAQGVSSQVTLGITGGQREGRDIQPPPARHSRIAEPDRVPIVIRPDLREKAGIGATGGDASSGGASGAGGAGRGGSVGGPGGAAGGATHARDIKRKAAAHGGVEVEIPVPQSIRKGPCRRSG